MGCDHRNAVRTFANVFAVARDGGVRLEVNVESLCSECMAAVTNCYRSTCQCSTVTGIVLAGDVPKCGACQAAYQQVELTARR